MEATPLSFARLGSAARAAERCRSADLIYDFGGLELRSALPLPGLRLSLDDAGSRPSIRLLVDRGCPAPAGPPIFRWPGRYGLTLATHDSGWLISSRTHGSVVVSSDGREVRCYPDSASSADWPDVLVRRILPRLMERHGRIVLHAAALSDGRSTTLLLGPTHSGKSTLAAALHRYLGWAVFSDDLAAIDHLQSPPICLPVGAGVCLLPDSLAAFAPQVPECRRVAGHEHKRWQTESAGDEAMHAQPIGCVLLLAPHGATEATGDRLSFRRLSAVDAAMHASASLILFNPADTSTRARSWKALGRLVETVPMLALMYPRRYECLPSVADAVRDLLADPARLTA